MELAEAVTDAKGEQEEEDTSVAAIYKQVQKLQVMLSNEATRVAASNCKLKKDIQLFEERQSRVGSVHFTNTIKLDIGGSIYKTTKDTLMKEDSMLASMFSGHGFKMEKDEDGCYFINRPGAPFAGILHYLQTGVFNPPSDPCKLKALQLEADFYQVQSLIDLLSTKEFPYENISSTGVIHWLGTSKDSVPYVNPVDSKIINVTGESSCPSGAVVDNINNKSDAGWCNDARNRYFTIILPLAVCPSSYSISHTQCCVPRHWVMSGSSDGEEWTELHMNTAANPMPAGGRANFIINNPDLQSFTQYRVMCNGHDASPTCYCFHVKGVEIYGKVSLSC